MLAHYIALNDDLYCSVVYQQFALNPLMREMGRDRFLEAQKSEYLCSMLGQSMQSYLKDACRLMNLRIYKIEVYEDAIRPTDEEFKDNYVVVTNDETQTDQKDETAEPVDTPQRYRKRVVPKTEDLQFGTPQISYFTNRILIGDSKEHAVMTKLCEVNNVLGAVSESEFKEAQKIYD